MYPDEVEVDIEESSQVEATKVVPHFVTNTSISAEGKILLDRAVYSPLVVGSSQVADVVIESDTVEDLHFMIEVVGEEWIISTINELAKLWVNDEPVKYAILENEDKIQVGQHKMVFICTA